MAEFDEKIVKDFSTINDTDIKSYLEVEAERQDYINRPKAEIEARKREELMNLGYEVHHNDELYAVCDYECSANKLIEEIMFGEIDWIKDTIHHTANTIIKIYVNNEIIEVTEGHQFWAIEKGRTRAADLESGDLLVDYQGNTFEITKIEKIENISIEVYEIMVEDARNYFVGNGHYQVFNEIIS